MILRRPRPLSVILVPLIALSLTLCKKQEAEAKATTVQGAATLLRAGESRPLAVNDELFDGDTIRTGADGIVVLRFRDTIAVGELQPQATMTIRSSANRKELALDQGNLWLQVNGGAGRPEFSVRTPTTVAAVRGTKFYTAQFGPLVGVCHCQGSVHYSAGGYEQNHSQDTLAFTRDGKTITLTLADLPAGIPYRHDHSSLENSPVGARSTLSAEQTRALLEVVQKKFAAAP